MGSREVGKLLILPLAEQLHHRKGPLATSTVGQMFTSLLSKATTLCSQLCEPKGYMEGPVQC